MQTFINAVKYRKRSSMWEHYDAEFRRYRVNEILDAVLDGDDRAKENLKDLENKHNIEDLDYVFNRSVHHNPWESPWEKRARETE